MTRPSPKRVAGEDGEPLAVPLLLRMSDVEPRNVAWLWPGRIPLGRLTLLVGAPGGGKSFVTIDAAARVSTGTPWPDGTDCPRGSVVLMSAEDDPHDTIRPRLDAHRADVSRIHLLSAVRATTVDGERERLISLSDVDAIEAALRQVPDCKLLVVDPVGSFLGGRTDAYRDNEVRSVLAPIAALAGKHGTAVVVVAHTRKSGGQWADDTALGSRAFTGIARACWHVMRDAGEKNRRLLLPGKNNLTAAVDGLAFTIGGQPVHVHWERDPVRMTADDGLAAHEARRGPAAVRQQQAAALLRQVLSEGPMLASDATKRMESAGVSEATLRRARKRLNVVAYRASIPGAWLWRLPDGDGDGQGAQHAQGEKPEHLERLADFSGVLPLQGAQEDQGAQVAAPERHGELDAVNGELDWAATNGAADDWREP